MWRGLLVAQAQAWAVLSVLPLPRAVDQRQLRLHMTPQAPAHLHLRKLPAPPSLP
jgi:hypothetical protein